MKRIFTLFLVVEICLLGSAQTGTADYWLNHGFTTGQTVLTNTGTFYDDGGYDLYQAGKDWTVRFCSENGNPVTVDFDHFRTIFEGGDYHNYDYMTINYTGDGGGYVAYDYDTPQFSFTSPDGCITFGFHSNSSTVRDSGWVAEISANPPPINNDQCSAVELAVGNVCSPAYYSNKGSWDTRGLGSPSCHKYFGGDVWFKAEVPPSGQLKIETFGGTLRNAVMVLYSGSCTSLSQITCEYNGAMPVKTISRTAGEMIYIRIFGDQAKSGTFGICATDPTAPITGFSGPGGVGDSLSNELWLRADRGVINDGGLPAGNNDNVKSWQDQSGNHEDINQLTVSNQAILSDASPGGMPTLAFDGNDDNYIKELGTLSAPITLFVVSKFNNVSRDETALTLGDASSAYSTSLSRDADSRYYSLTGSKRYGPVLNPDENAIIEVKHGIAIPYHQLVLNGTSQSVDDYGAPLSTDGSLHIGSSGSLSGYFDGSLAEVFFYSRKVNRAQEIIINNYLAAKYGIDILSMDRYDYESSHKYDVAGIGRTDAQNIHSKAQSDGILTIGGPDDLDDGEFLLFGHDNGDITAWTTNETPGSDPNVRRIAREWRIDQSGGNGVGTVTVGLSTGKLPELPAGFLAYNILVDDDGDFSSGASAYGLIKSGDEYLANNIALADGSFITIIAVKPWVSFDTTASEGPESLEHPAFPVSLNYAISDPFEVNYRVVSGTATGGGTDYSLNPGSISFIPGQKTQDIVPLIVNDTIVEIPNEYFQVALRSPTAGVLLDADSLHRYTIIDDDMTVSVTATDTITGYCRSSRAMLYASAEGQGPFTYSWSPVDSLSDPVNDTTEVYPSETTTYTVTVTDKNGYSEQESIVIYVDNAPVKPAVIPDGTVSICNGDSLVLTSDSAYSYHWSNGETTRSVTVKTAGNYSLYAIDEWGCESEPSDPVNIQLISVPKPEITALTDTVICEGDTVKLSTSAPAIMYTWSDGSNSDTINVTSGGIYTVRVTDVNGCSSVSSDPVSVKVNPLPPKPVIVPDSPVSLCEGDTAELSTAKAAGSYLWSDGSGNSMLYATAAGSYSVIVTDGNGCESQVSDPVDVIINSLPLKPVIDSSGNLSFCEGGSVELTASPADGYQWSNGETTRTVVVGEQAIMSVKVSNSAGCFSEESDPVSVEVYPLPAVPVITPDGEVRILQGDSAMLTSSEADGYLWSTGETTRTIYVKTSGDYTVQALSGHGCLSRASDPVSVSVNQFLPKPSITVNGSTELCEGQTVELIGQEAASYQWSNGETTQTIMVGAAGTYTLVITDSEGRQSIASDPVTVTVNTNPEPSIEITDVSCFAGSDGSATVTVANGRSPFVFTWTNGSSTQSIGGLEAGALGVSVTDSNGCSGDDQAIIEQPGKIEISANIIPAKCPEAGDASIFLDISGGVSPYTYEWNDGEFPVKDRVNLTTGDYKVTVTDMNQCVESASFAVDYQNEVCFRIPDIITPNNDGMNDTWMIEGLDLYPDVVVEVFDRWGKRVFYSRGYDQPWDGTFDGRELPMESYHYVIDLKNGRKPVIGNITIVR